jgi:hypothetical protein
MSSQINFLTRSEKINEIQEKMKNMEGKEREMEEKKSATTKINFNYDFFRTPIYTNKTEEFVMQV